MTTATRCTRSLLLAAALAIPAGAHAQTWSATLGEEFGNGSTGTGTATFVLSSTDIFTISVNFANMLGATTASHIHCCTAVPFAGTAGVATTTPSFVGFPLGVTAGSFDQTYNTLLASTWNPAFITANGGSPLSAETVFLAGLIAGQTYFNIHTTAFGAGEIRSFLTVTQLIPEPGTLALLALGLVAAAIPGRRRSR
jgi:hypothetical protein